MSKEISYDSVLYYWGTFGEIDVMAAIGVKITVLWFVTPCV
jgi:hypothetical protein